MLLPSAVIFNEWQAASALGQLTGTWELPDRHMFDGTKLALLGTYLIVLLGTWVVLDKFDALCAGCTYMRYLTCKFHPKHTGGQ